jgi:hypothetical protein
METMLTFFTLLDISDVVDETVSSKQEVPRVTDTD